MPCELNSNSPLLSSLSPKVSALESSLQLSVDNLKDLQNDLERLSTEVGNYKTQLFVQRERCDSQSCVGSEALKKIIKAKDVTINLVASTATKLNETKDFVYLQQLFKILCGEQNISTPIKDVSNNIKTKSPSFTPENGKTTIKEEPNTSIEDVSYREESVSEIEGTPGRTSPVLTAKKLKSSSSSNLTGNTSECRDKKKCPEEWTTPESKQVKLIFPITSRGKLGTGAGRLRQSRLTFVNTKPSSVVDLTSSPELVGGRLDRSDSLPDVKPLIKKELSENDDTILPSPTSGPTNFLLSKSTAKDFQPKFKKPLSLSRVKTEATEENSPILQVFERRSVLQEVADMEDSINILQPNKFQNGFKSSPMKSRTVGSPRKKNSPRKLPSRDLSLKSPKKCSSKTESPKKHPIKSSPKKSINTESPIKCLINENPRRPIETQSPKKSPKKARSPKKSSDIENMNPCESKVEPMEEDVTCCDEASVSILHEVDQLRVEQQPERSTGCKQPLADNTSSTNVPHEDCARADDSLSVLQPQNNEDIIVKMKQSVPAQAPPPPLYKEVLPRRKADKRALPGWLCDDCTHVMRELYADEPEKIARVIARCSKHRGRSNPARPNTPEGFWNPRWDVPRDTEEFNRRNNAV